MKPTAVYIATTEGPSEIQRITPEDPDVRSVVCHDGRAIALPISADYDTFVRRPTGVIEAGFGHSAYRVDVAVPIASGSSWQLGLFIAHALFDEGGLVRPDDAKARIVWATGEVSRDLTVLAVEDVDRKIRQSESQIRNHLDTGSTVLLAVPVDNLDEATRAASDVFADDVGRLRIVAAETVCDVLTVLGLKNRRRLTRWLGLVPAAAGPGRWGRRASYAVTAALVAATAFVGWQKAGPGTEAGAVRANAVPANAVRAIAVSLRSEPKPVLAAVSLTTRPPAGKPCAAVHLGQAVARTTRHGNPDVPSVTRIPAKGLCDFRYRLINRSQQPVSLWVLATRGNSQGGDFRLRPLHAAKPVAAGGVLELDARPPRQFSLSLRQSLVALSLPPGTGDARHGLNALWDQAVRAASPRELNQVLDRARNHGAAVLRLTHEFTP